MLAEAQVACEHVEAAAEAVDAEQRAAALGRASSALYDACAKLEMQRDAWAAVADRFTAGTPSHFLNEVWTPPTSCHPAAPSLLPRQPPYPPRDA